MNKMTAPKVDEIDLMLLRDLQDNARVSNADLARRVDLSPPSVLQRVRRLEETGIVSGYCGRLNPVALGFQLLVIVQVSLSLGGKTSDPIDTFRKAVNGLDNVLECHHVSGDFDFILKVVAKDMADFEDFIRGKLSRIDGVGKIQSCFVLNTSKETIALPI